MTPNRRATEDHIQLLSREWFGVKKDVRYVHVPDVQSAPRLGHDVRYRFDMGMIEIATKLSD